MTKFTKLLAGGIAAATLATVALAANPNDLKKVDNVGKFSTCSGCDLTGADLHGRLLRLAILPGVNLGGANLNGADMAGALLWDSKLQGASFVFTNLSGAQMMNADASGANFTNAWLSHVQAQNAKFGTADFTGAHIRDMQLHGADISQVKGLDLKELARACGDSATKLPAGAYIPRCSE